ncbi:MAG: hypothetical protein ABEK04_05235 [Candidatus Nanohalobium sp.]
MPSQFQRNQRDAEEVIEQLEGIPEPEEMYDEVMVTVHPGFCLTNEKYTAAEGLRREDYLRHTIELHQDIQEAYSNEVPVDLVFRNQEGAEALRYLGEHAEAADNFIQSNYGSGFITEEHGQQSLAETMKKVEDGGKIGLYGEINGLCYTQFEDLVREVNRNMDKEINVTSERPFPEDPLDRTQGVLHWEDEVPPYVQALEFQSAYR